jgi:hypothetical protein
MPAALLACFATLREPGNSLYDTNPDRRGLLMLGVRLRGHEGLCWWLEWVSARVQRIEFSPRVITVDGDTFFEELGVAAILSDGRRFESRWAEVPTYRDNLVTSLRLYVDPIDSAPALRVLGRIVGLRVGWPARHGLGP